MKICRGRDALTGLPVEVAFGTRIETVTALPGAGPDTRYVAPGWIDVQVNGFAGVDYCSPEASHEEIGRSIRALWATGVTRFFPTVITGPPEKMAAAIRNLARAKEALAREGASIEGLHVEGPHISPEDGPRGAHPRDWVRAPDVDELERWVQLAGGCLKLVTLDPGWPGACAYIEAARRRGVAVGIGHTGATGRQIADAASAGAVLSTHLGNGAHAMLPRHPNYIWEQLAEDRLAASFIVDGIHLPPSFLKTALRAKGAARSILITDAVAPAGCGPGPYRIGEVDIELHGDGRVTLAGGDRLAGSSLTMHRGVAMLVALAGLELSEAVAMASCNPARVCGIPGRRRGLQPGERADLVEFRFEKSPPDVVVERVWMAGAEVWVA